MNKPEFVTPVCMDCTYEQFNKELLPIIGKLNLRFIMKDSKENAGLLTVTVNYSDIFTRQIIRPYNLELFDALSHMTKGDVPIVGEYLVARKNFKLGVGIERKTPVVFKCDKELLEFAQHEEARRYFIRKPTVKELIDHFTKPDVFEKVADAVKEENKKFNIKEAIEFNKSAVKYLQMASEFRKEMGEINGFKCFLHWFDKQNQEPAVFENLKVGDKIECIKDMPGYKKGEVVTVEFIDTKYPLCVGFKYRFALSIDEVNNNFKKHHTSSSFHPQTFASMDKKLLGTKPTLCDTIKAARIDWDQVHSDIDKIRRLVVEVEKVGNEPEVKHWKETMPKVIFYSPAGVEHIGYFDSWRGDIRTSAFIRNEDGRCFDIRKEDIKFL